MEYFCARFDGRESCGQLHANAGECRRHARERSEYHDALLCLPMAPLGEDAWVPVERDREAGHVAVLPPWPRDETSDGADTPAVAAP